MPDMQLNDQHIIPFSYWAIGLIVLITSSFIVLIGHTFYMKQRLRFSTFFTWYDFLVKSCKGPFFFLILSYVIFFGLHVAKNYLPKILPPLIDQFSPLVLRLIEFAAFFWLIINALSLGRQKLLIWSTQTANKTAGILLVMLSSSLQAAIFLLMVNMLIPALGLNGFASIIATKFSKLFLIAILGWIFYRLVDSLTRLILNQYLGNDALAFRKINTQVTLLKRVILALGILVTFAAMLMVFDSVRNLGTGLLTTAGILSAVGAFASQQSLARLFAGLQIAFTQPIRIGDTVIIDNEFGQIEEITLSYIVVKLWDLRRLILPTDYFTSKGLQNLTRESTQLLGTIFVYADYTLPIKQVREQFYKILEESTLWDKKVRALEVTDIKEASMEIRALMSAENASTLWKLRCEMREKLIAYLVQAHPECLAVKRNITLYTPKEQTQLPFQTA